MKKLIYAIEQAQISAVKTSSDVTLPALHKKNVKSIKMAGQTELKTASGFFGGLDDQSSPGKANAKSPTSKSSNQPGSSDILFLKRLLYLKASIDNDVGLNTFSVPFQEEKVRDNARPEQLMFDTNIVTQKRDSNLDTDINRIEEQYLQITEGPSKTEMLPNTSQGFRLRNSGVGMTTQPLKSGVDKMGLSSFLNEGKKVQTA